ncbi:hypothetical protein D3C76_621050 [compost metagenome]
MFQVLLNGLSNQWIADQIAQFRFQRYGQAVGVGLVAQGAEAIGQVFQLFGLLRIERCIGLEQFAVIPGANRETVFVVLDMEAAVPGIEAQGQGAVLQRHAVIAAQERQEQLAFHQRIGRVPLDVEKLAVGAQASPLQQVQPPGIVSAADRHVVGDNVEDQPHVLLVQGVDQAAQRPFASQFRVDPGRVHHVIAMHRSGSGTQQRGGVDMADAQACEIRHQRHRIFQRETFMKLQAQRGAQRAGRLSGHRSRSAACSRAQASSSRRRAASGPSSRASL